MRLLDDRSKEAPAEEPSILRERASILSVRALREQAIDELRKMAGKTVGLKLSGSDVSGAVSADQCAQPGISLKVSDGPELAFTVAEMLDSGAPVDVDQFAPKLSDHAENSCASAACSS